MLKEKISRNLGVPYIEIEQQGEKSYLCSNGVLFKDSEYMNYSDLKQEYEHREKEEAIYDYDYAKSTGLLRRKEDHQEVQNSAEKALKKEDGAVPTDSKSSTPTVLVIVILLGFTSLISMYISTLHTATYLFDYVDVISAWLMSTSVTAYNSTAFEVSVIFKKKKRCGLTTVFMGLWLLVTLFSMATTISVFYDRFNFNELQTEQDNEQLDSTVYSLSLLQKKEADLREAIEFKKKDIEYRQEKDYATASVRKELNDLQEQLQRNLSEQQNLVTKTPNAVKEDIKRKESIFTYLGRLLHCDGGILAFILSTLSAIFVNLIAPLSLTAVIELMYKKD